MPTGMASAANRYTTVVHIHVRDFMFLSSFLRDGDSGLPGAESPMRTCGKFKAGADGETDYQCRSGKKDGDRLVHRRGEPAGHVQMISESPVPWTSIFRRCLAVLLFILATS